jgi:hypothetical protein
VQRTNYSFANILRIRQAIGQAATEAQGNDIKAALIRAMREEHAVYRLFFCYNGEKFNNDWIEVGADETPMGKVVMCTFPGIRRNLVYCRIQQSSYTDKLNSTIYVNLEWLIKVSSLPCQTMVFPVSDFSTLSLVELKSPRSLNIFHCFLDCSRVPQ